MSKYISHMTSPFFRWWWAAITGVVSISSLLIIPEQGVVIGPGWLMVLVLVFFTSSFLIATLIVQSWSLFCGPDSQITVKAILHNEDAPGDYDKTFLLCTTRSLAKGALLELRRKMNNLEPAFAIIEIGDVNSGGDYLSSLVWIASGQLNELTQGEFGAVDILVSNLMQSSTYAKSRPL